MQSTPVPQMPALPELSSIISAQPDLSQMFGAAPELSKMLAFTPQLLQTVVSGGKFC